MSGEALGAATPSSATPIGQAVGFDQGVGHVHAEAVHAAIEPEAQGLLEFCVDSGVVPVEVGLRGIEQVQEPLTGITIGLGDAGPRWATKVRLPVVRRQSAVGSLAIAEDEHFPFGAARAPASAAWKS